MGRKIKFDQESVSEAVMNLFWKQGYCDTSVDDLLRATGLQSGSLYRSFGNKKRLFIASIRRYNEKVVLPRQQAILGSADKVGAIQAFFVGLVNRNLADTARRGCLNTNSIAEIGLTDRQIGQALLESSLAWEKVFLRSLREAKKKKQLSPRHNVHRTAKFLVALTQALNVTSKIRRDRAFLVGVMNAGLEVLR